MNPLTPDPAAPLPQTDRPGSSVPSWMELDPSVVPNLDNLVTVDDTPVDSILAEKLHRLLTEPLYSSWTGDGQPFLALANVGYFYAYRQPPVVPDMLLALDATASGDLNTKEGHSYFQWLQAKPADVVIEIVSDRRGGDDGHKLRLYARQGVPYYVIFDPEYQLGENLLRAFRLSGRNYESTDPGWFPEVGLGLTLWQGTFEGLTRTWLRWCDREGRVIPTGAERAEQERRRADEATAKLQRLAAKLRELGIEPEV
jgi:Uma2 family endonuclease